MQHEIFMSKALEHAQEALHHNEFPVGCVLVHDQSIIASGKREGSLENNETDHAEINAIKNLIQYEKSNNLSIPRDKIILYCTLEPCLMCFAALLIHDIRHIVYAYEDVMGGGTKIDLQSLPCLYKDRPVTILPGIMREKSLKLFQTFFQHSNHRYLQGTTLAIYTLNQK